MLASVWHLYGSAFCLVRIGVPYVALGVHLVSPGFVCMQKIYFLNFMYMYFMHPIGAYTSALDIKLMPMHPFYYARCCWSV